MVQAALKFLDWDVLLHQLVELPVRAVCDFGLEEEVRHVQFAIGVKVRLFTA